METNQTSLSAEMSALPDNFLDVARAELHNALSEHTYNWCDLSEEDQDNILDHAHIAFSFAELDELPVEDTVFEAACSYLENVELDYDEDDDENDEGHYPTYDDLPECWVFVGGNIGNIDALASDFVWFFAGVVPIDHKKVLTQDQISYLKYYSGMTTEYHGNIKR